MQKRCFFLSLCIIVPTLFLPSISTASEPYSLTVLPSEHTFDIDPDSGAQLIYLTTNEAPDYNLYFHDQSWLSDESMILFVSSREGGGLMGYIVATGELVHITSASGGSVGGATAAMHFPGVYVKQGNNILLIRFEIELSASPESAPSRVFATEKRIATLPDHANACALNENSNGKWLSIGLAGKAVGPPSVYIIKIRNGKIKFLCESKDNLDYASHVQWSRTNPHLLSFAGLINRLMVVDIRKGIPRNIYKQWDNELVTHESWWVDDQMIFFGSTNPEPLLESHTKVIDVHTGQVRVIGAGGWWKGGTPKEPAKQNWWHGAGSMDGRWIVADNWHGDIGLFEAHTTRERILTSGHRSYGKGGHPHVGWDRDGTSVIFTSHTLGNPNVCIATIPEAWGDFIHG